MNIFVYDNSFEGLLTAIFDSYQMKVVPDQIVPGGIWQNNFFGNKISIVTDENKAERVWAGLERKISAKACQMPYKAFLSEMNKEMLVYRFVRKVFDTPCNIELNFGDTDVLEIKKLNRKVTREACRMLEFARFQKTKDNIFYASIAPKYNVLPIIFRHFEKRFTDQYWIIYDIKRNWGMYYNLERSTEIKLELENVDKGTGRISKEVMGENEDQFQFMWKDYFDTINIKERKNPRCQMNFMPKRFWQYMTEKNIDMLKVD